MIRFMEDTVDRSLMDWPEDEGGNDGPEPEHIMLPPEDNDSDAFSVPVLGHVGVAALDGDDDGYVGDDDDDDDDDYRAMMHDEFGTGPLTASAEVGDDDDYGGVAYGDVVNVPPRTEEAPRGVNWIMIGLAVAAIYYLGSREG